MKCELCGTELVQVGLSDAYCPACGASQRPPQEEPKPAPPPVEEKPNDAVATPPVEWTQIAKMSMIAWAAMLFFSFFHFSYLWGFWFTSVGFAGFSFFSPVVLLACTFGFIKLDRIELMVFPLGVHLLFFLTTFGVGLLSFINLFMIALIAVLFFLCVAKQLSMIPAQIRDAIDQVTSSLPIRIDMKVVTIASVACFALLALFILGFYGFGGLFSSFSLRNLAFFAGTAMLGLQSFVK